LMDVRNGAVWVSIDDIYRAMRTVDSRTGLPRGMVEIQIMTGV